jgi:hypothetical protein
MQIPGDGNCFFHAFARALSCLPEQQTVWTAEHVRSFLADFLVNNLEPSLRESYINAAQDNIEGNPDEHEHCCPSGKFANWEDYVEKHVRSMARSAADTAQWGDDLCASAAELAFQV